MNIWRPILPFLAALTTALGCTAPLPEAGRVGNEPPLSATAVDVQSGRTLPAPAGSVAAETGTLTLVIRWPAVVRQAQLIPLSAQSMRVEVLNGAGGVVASQTVGRTTGSNLSVVTVEVDAGTGYRVSAKAFAEPVPGPDAVPIALGDAINVLVRKSKTTQVTLEIVPTSTPAITAITPANGGVGRQIRIRGRNFGASGSLDLSLRFGGVPATNVTRLDDETLDAVVPTGAKSGNVTATVDGVPSGSSSPFSVIGSLVLTALDSLFLAGDSRILTVVARDENATPLSDPIVDWASDRPSIVSVDTTGRVTSLGTTDQTVGITVWSGLASTSLSLRVLPRPVSVTLTPGTGTLNAAAEDGASDPVFVTNLPVEAVVLYSDGSTDSAVTWATSDPKLGFYESGRVRAANNAPEGTLILTATASRDGTTKGTASFVVTTYGHAAVTIQ